MSRKIYNVFPIFCILNTHYIYNQEKNHLKVETRGTLGKKKDVEHRFMTTEVSQVKSNG